MKRRQGIKSKLIKLSAVLIVIAGLGVGAKSYFTEKPAGGQVEAAYTTPESRNDTRRMHLKLLAGALKQYAGAVGTLPVKISAQGVGICSGTGVVCKQSGMVDLMFLTSRGYIDALPSDPVGGMERRSTGYQISRDTATGSIVLTAPRAESGAVISETVN